MAITMIVNPNAGKKQGAAVAERAVSLLQARNLKVDTVVSEYPGQSRILASQIDQQAVDGVVAVGGDGTLFEVVNGLMEGRKSIAVPVGQIPVGTGNSFIKDFAIYSVEDAVEKISAGSPRPVDLGKFTCSAGEYYFINILGTGFASNVAYRAIKYKKFGALSYILAVLEEVAVLKSTPITVEIDGTSYERDTIFVEICNSKLTGGNMIMSPESKYDDGLLDVVIVSKINRRKLLRLFPGIFKGQHVLDTDVEVVSGKHITFKSAVPLGLNIDGETFGETPLDITVCPAALTMYG